MNKAKACGAKQQGTARPIRESIFQMKTAKATDYLPVAFFLLPPKRMPI